MDDDVVLVEARSRSQTREAVPIPAYQVKDGHFENGCYVTDGHSKRHCELYDLLGEAILL